MSDNQHKKNFLQENSLILLDFAFVDLLLIAHYVSRTAVFVKKDLEFSGLFNLAVLIVLILIFVVLALSVGIGRMILRVKEFGVPGLFYFGELPKRTKRNHLIYLTTIALIATIEIVMFFYRM